MKRTSQLLLAVFALAIITVAGSANAQIYQATTSNGNNGLNFGPDGTSNPPTGAGYWEMGNTITFSGSAASYTLDNADVWLYGGGDVNYPVEMQIFSGSNPNTGTLLYTATAPAGYGVNEAVFNFAGDVVPGTVTYILSLPDQNGSYDSIFLYPILTSGGAPTIGSGPNSLWYGTSGSFVTNTTYAEADGAGSNYLQAEFTALPEGGAALIYLLLAGAVCFGAIFLKSRNEAGNSMLA